MVIKSLKLKNYRNYELLNLTFDPKTNILYGDNAQGKTNILEALYLSGTTKSHRGTKDRDLIQFGREESHLETVVEKNGVLFQIDMHLKKNSPKGIAINKIPIRRAGELFGIVHFVFFSPEDLNIIKRTGRRGEDLSIWNYPSLTRSILVICLTIIVLSIKKKFLAQRNCLSKRSDRYIGYLGYAIG